MTWTHKTHLSDYCTPRPRENCDHRMQTDHGNECKEDPKHKTIHTVCEFFAETHFSVDKKFWKCLRWIQHGRKPLPTSEDFSRFFGSNILSFSIFSWKFQGEALGVYRFHLKIQWTNLLQARKPVNRNRQSQRNPPNIKSWNKKFLSWNRYSKNKISLKVIKVQAWSRKL